MISKTSIANTIKAALHNRPDLIAVYLFGSVAQDRAHALSDVDVALLFPAEFDSETIFKRTLEIGVILEAALNRPIDVIALNQASSALRFQVLKYGILLLERNRTERCLFVMRALNRYYDIKPYLDYQHTQLLARIKKEGLGRGYRGHRNALAEARRLSAQLASNTSHRAR